MKVGWFGYGGNQWLVEMHRDLIQNMGHQLHTCHEYENATVKYDKDSINQFIDSVDVILLPHREMQPAKSTNKLAIAWSRGKPCIVGPRPSYMKFVKEGENALVFNNAEDLRNAIKKMESDELRRKLGHNGQQVAFNKFHPRTSIDDFFKSYSKLNIKPHVHIAIPHYAPRADYISLAVESAVRSKGVTVSVQVVSSSKSGPPEVGSYPNVNVYHQNERLSFSSAVNKALKMAPPQTTHYLVFNDDAILSENALRNMLDSMGEDEIILNPWSNCDKGWLHNDDLLLGPNKQLVPNMIIEDFSEEELNSLFKYDPVNYTKDKYSGCNFCALYCTLFPKSVLEKVGFLNENFHNGGEDADFSFRARRLGIISAWTRNAFVYHFGGKTRKSAEDEDYSNHHAEDQANNKLLAKRWPKGKKRIAIWTGPAWEKWDMDSPYTSGIGGSETCAIRLAEYASSLGHNVTLYGDHDDKEQYGVQLKHYSQYRPEEEYWDLFVSSRSLSPITQSLRAGNVLVWVHDIFILGVKDVPEEIDSLITKYVALSPWHLEFLSNYHSIEKERITIIPNGVDDSLFK